MSGTPGLLSAIAVLVLLAASYSPRFVGTERCVIVAVGLIIFAFNLGYAVASRRMELSQRGNTMIILLSLLIAANKPIDTTGR